MSDLTLPDARNERDQLAGRTDVLDRVGVLRTLPDGVHVSTPMIAEFYGVPVETVKNTVKRNREEFEADGYTVIARGEVGFKVALTAGRADECDVDRITRSLGLRIGYDKNCEEIGCISTMLKVYRDHGPAAFSFAMRVIRDAYGFDGFKENVIKALALITNRYGNSINEEALAAKLAKKGLPEVNYAAKSMKEATGNPYPQCYAHAMINVYNVRNANRVEPWWNLGVIGAA